MRLHCYRHGESIANAGGVTGDPASIPLTALGEEQARRLAANCVIAPELILSSPFRRARDTAQPLIERFPEASVETWDVQEFTYLSPSRCSDSTRAQRRPMVEAYWARSEPGYVDGPGAESFAEFANRVTRVMTALQHREERLVCLFGHEQFIQAMMLWARAGALEASAGGMQRYFLFREQNPIANGECVVFARSAGDLTVHSPAAAR
jgi:broad specificity phosphatase PhoE